MSRSKNRIVSGLKSPHSLEKAVMMLKGVRGTCEHVLTSVGRSCNINADNFKEKIGEKNWKFKITCCECDSFKVEESNNPICLSCSTGLDQHFMEQAGPTKAGPGSYDIVVTYYCGNCKKSEEVLLRSEW